MEQGEICIGGVDIRRIATAKLMDMVSFVFQDTFLFYDTLYENITVGSPVATKEKVIAAAKAPNVMTSLRNCHKVTKQGLVTKACFSPVVKHNGYVWHVPY